MKRLKKLKVGRQNLFVRYGRDHIFAKEIKIFHALAYLDPSEIMEAFQEIYDQVSVEAKLYADEFFRIYVSNSARYSKSFWSVADLIQNGMPRTQVWAESFHNQMNSVLVDKHVGIYTFVKFMKDRFVVIKSEIDSYIQGNPVKKRSKKHLLAETAINNILAQKDQYSYYDVLYSIACNTGI